jgi:hypothetical protein
MPPRSRENPARGHESEHVRQDRRPLAHRRDAGRDGLDGAGRALVDRLAHRERDRCEHGRRGDGAHVDRARPRTVQGQDELPAGRLERSLADQRGGGLETRSHRPAVNAGAEVGVEAGGVELCELAVEPRRNGLAGLDAVVSWDQVQHSWVFLPDLDASRHEKLAANRFETLSLSARMPACLRW